MRMLLVFLFLLLLVAGIWFLWTSDGSLGFRIEAASLQADLEAQFPIEKDLTLADLRLSDPRLRLDPGSQRVTLVTRLEAKSRLFRDIEEQALLSGGLRYDPEQGAVFFEEVTVIIDSTEDKDNRQKTIEAAATAFADDYFRDHPIYIVQETDLKSRLIRAYLADIEISKRAIRLQFELKSSS